MNSEECGPLSHESACLLSKDSSSVEPFVYGFMDLFGTFGESWGIDLGVDRSDNNSSMQSNSLQSSQYNSRFTHKKLDADLKLPRIHSLKQSSAPAINLPRVEEECDVESASNSSPGEEAANIIVRNGLTNAKNVRILCFQLFCLRMLALCY